MDLTLGQCREDLNQTDTNGKVIDIIYDDGFLLL